MSVRFPIFSWAVDSRPQYVPYRLLSLALLMFRVGADDPHHTLAVDHLALITNLLNRGSYLHDAVLSFSQSGRANACLQLLQNLSARRVPREGQNCIMKVRASVKKICDKCKVIHRQGVV